MIKNHPYRLVSLVHCADMWENNTWRWLKALQAETVVCCAPGNQCRAGQSLQQQAEEAVEAVEVCRMLRKEGKWNGGRWGVKNTNQREFSVDSLGIRWNTEECEECLP